MELKIGAAVVMIALSAWAAAAIYFKWSDKRRRSRVAASAWIGVSAVLVAMLSSAYATSAVVAFALAYVAILAWWWSLRPRNDRTWNDDVARMTTGVVAGDLLMLQNVRNFVWRSRDDYTQRWETRTYELDRLQTLDMIVSYWAGPAIAHTLVSFGFAPDGDTPADHVVFSVEIRRRRGQLFSEVGGFFRMYELSILAATENDAIRVRTNVRSEDDYLFRVRMPPAKIRSLLLAYVDEATRLVARPRFYNTITANCTTIIYQMVKRIIGRLPLSHRLLLSGYLPEYVHAIGGLDARFSVGELRRFGRITERARQIGPDADFSAAIRSGIPPLDEASSR